MSIVKHKDRMLKSTLMAPKWTREWGQRRSSTAISRMVRQPAANCPKDWQTTAPSLQLRLQPSVWHWIITKHGPSPSWCGSLLWLNVLFAGNWGWRHQEPFYLPYHEPALVIEWQGHTCIHYADMKPLVNSYIQMLVQTQWDVAVHDRDIYLVKPTLGPPKKFQHSTRAEEVVITRIRIGHTKATKSHILSRGPPTGCHHCGQTLTIDHMLLKCTLLQECRDEYYTVDSLNALFQTIPETCIVEFLREAGFFYLMWCNLSTLTCPQTWTIWSNLSNWLEWKQLWDTFTCVGQLFIKWKQLLRHIYLCRTAYTSWRTCVVVNQIQSNQTKSVCHISYFLWFFYWDYIVQTYPAFGCSRRRVSQRISRLICTVTIGL